MIRWISLLEIRQVYDEAQEVVVVDAARLVLPCIEG